jgi:hypothetical protein
LQTAVPIASIGLGSSNRRQAAKLPSSSKAPARLKGSPLKFNVVFAGTKDAAVKAGMNMAMALSVPIFGFLSPLIFSFTDFSVACQPCRYYLLNSNSEYYSEEARYFPRHGGHAVQVNDFSSLRAQSWDCLGRDSGTCEGHLKE